MSPFTRSLFLAFVTVAFSPAVRADVVTISPIDGTYNSVISNANGATTTTLNTTGANLFADYFATTSGSGSTSINRFLLEFDLSAIPSGATIDSAVLKWVGGALYVDGSQYLLTPYVGDGVLSANEVNGSFNLVSAQLTPINPPGSSYPYLFDAKSAVEEVVTEGYSHLGFQQLDYAIGEFGIGQGYYLWTGFSLSSSESANVAYRPTLTVTYSIPEFGTLGLSCVGLIGMLAACRLGRRFN